MLTLYAKRRGHLPCGLSYEALQAQHLTAGQSQQMDKKIFTSTTFGDILMVVVLSQERLELWRLYLPLKPANKNIRLGSKSFLKLCKTPLLQLRPKSYSPIIHNGL